MTISDDQNTILINNDVYFFSESSFTGYYSLSPCENCAFLEKEPIFCAIIPCDKSKRIDGKVGFFSNEKNNLK